jgi:hypothetical protein
MRTITTSLILLCGCLDARGAATGLSTERAITATPSKPIDLRGQTADQGDAGSFMRSDARFAVTGVTCTSSQAATSTDGGITCKAVVNAQASNPGTPQSGSINVLGAGSFGSTLSVGGTSVFNNSADFVGEVDMEVGGNSDGPFYMGDGKYIEAEEIGGTLLLGSFAQTAYVTTKTTGGFQSQYYDSVDAGTVMNLGLVNASAVDAWHKLNVSAAGVDTIASGALHLGSTTATSIDLAQPAIAASAKNTTQCSLDGASPSVCNVTISTGTRCVAVVDGVDGGTIQPLATHVTSATNCRVYAPNGIVGLVNVFSW